jgi:hypothetical protein
MKVLYTLTTVALLGCSEIAGSASGGAECNFDYSNLQVCTQSDYKVVIQSHRLAVDEIQLQALQANYRGKQQLLDISDDTSMLEGDKGIILFEDINFDGIPDLAVSTSFGLANLYMDYWTFDKEKDQFVKVGNYARFTLHPSDKSLSNTVKTDAATYQENTYTWKSGKLVRK